jgi:hypothetical protein
MWIVLYRNTNYVSYNDSDMRANYFHGYHVNQQATIDLLRCAGADEVSVIVKDNDPDIPALRRIEEFGQAGYTYISTPIEGTMTYRLRRIKEPS